MVWCVPLNVARLSPLSLNELWVKTSMHRTSGTILVTSRNKVKTSFPSPLLHTCKRVQHSNKSSTTTLHRRRGPLSTASHRRKSLHWVPRYEKPHTTLNSTKSSQQGKTLPTYNTWEFVYCQQSTHHHITHGKIKFHQQPINLLTNTFKNKLNEWHSFKYMHNITHK